MKTKIYTKYINFSYIIYIFIALFQLLKTILNSFSFG